jgi:hypothetical protein
MTDKLCTGCNLNHIHNDARPIILTHNKKPFQDYATLETEVKRLMLAPGQAAIGYYVDPTAEDGLSSVIVVGSLESGCFPEIFKSAHQIDDLVDYFNRLIETQTSDMQQLGEDLREQIINEVTILNNTTIQELKTIMNSSLSEQNARFIVEMDDFGSGYSSLNVLKDMPIDVLKIDMGFVKGVESDEKTMKVLHNVINMSTDLNIVSLTEGVETKAQFDILTSMGCKLFQGYYFAKPMPVEEFQTRYTI